MTQPPTDIALSGTRCHDVSGAEGLQWRIFVSRPSDAATPCPALFLLDGNAAFPAAVAAQRCNPALGSLAVIGIGYPGEGAYFPERRFMDMTPATDLATLPHQYGPMHPGGGQERFADLIEQQLLPQLIEQEGLDAERLTLFGHSLGGLFAVHLALRRPGLFARYFASSPSLWFNREAVNADVAAYRAAMAEGSGMRGILNITTGGKEADYMQREAAHLAATLETLDGSSTVKSMVFAGEDHISVHAVAVNRALQLAAGRG
ncbi:alpha/beta hydrolase-fold protein [Silvimonas sp. JCM 19000]